MTVDEAAALIAISAWGPGTDPQRVIADPRRAIRDAMKRHHPDHGGDPVRFRRILDARDVLGATVGRPEAGPG